VDTLTQRGAHGNSVAESPTKEKTLTVLFMGDSITEGQYVDPPARWVDIVADSLTEKFSDAPIAVKFLSRGISGETTRQGLERFPRDVQAHGAEIITIQFGLNDCNCWDTDLGLPRVSLAAYRANLVEMIDRARRFGAREVVLSTNHPTLRRAVLASGRTLEEGRVEYNAVVRDIAAEKGVTLCDIDAYFGKLPDRLETLLLGEPDILHLSKTGHQRYAAAIRPYLEAALSRSIEQATK
jgi:lysophospholipase L1-like esterase